MTIVTQPAEQLAAADDMVISGIVGHVATARNHLLCATLGVNDLGYEWDDLHRAYAFTAGLVADLHGRERPITGPPAPGYFAQAAIEWRAERSRRARR